VSHNSIIRYDYGPSPLIVAPTTIFDRYDAERIE